VKNEWGFVEKYLWDLELSCSCEDSAKFNMVFYAEAFLLYLAGAIDQYPHLIFHLIGINLPRLKQFSRNPPFGIIYDTDKEKQYQQPWSKERLRNIFQWIESLEISDYKYLLYFDIKDQDPGNFNLRMEMQHGGKTRSLQSAIMDDTSITNADCFAPVTVLALVSPTAAAMTANEVITRSIDEATFFLAENLDLINNLGIELVLPKKIFKDITTGIRANTFGDLEEWRPSYLHLEEILDWDWSVHVGSDEISLEKFKSLVNQKSAVVKFKDSFCIVNKKEITSFLRKIESGKKPTKQELLQHYLTNRALLPPEVMKQMASSAEDKEYPLPTGFTGVLRPYQERGYNWISSLFQSGFGCILADDMGLGKTIQAIAAVLRLKNEGLLSKRCLVVVPVSLMLNWEREIKHFAPSLSVYRYHGGNRRHDAEVDIIITTYGTAVNDKTKFLAAEFSCIILDEVQLIKNSETRRSVILKSFRSDYRIALSGTPVENSLDDLYSIFDFVIPGYLGKKQDFELNFQEAIEGSRNEKTAEQLKKIVKPFMLRRLKTDKTIIADLPEKVVQNEYSDLALEQTALYHETVKLFGEKLAELKNQCLDPNIKRKKHAFLVINLITALKEICDHPRLYDKKSPAISNSSGKSKILITLLGEILAGGEKVLVFSQYVQMLEILQAVIEKELGEKPPIFHGGLNQKKRNQMIDSFQGEKKNPILLVSLKAGGTGLNLTAASHVIHYDLWYNPAVENQATDRVHRIGQDRTVFVHRLIASNTFEEKIDAMLTAKRELADLTVTSGESWLLKMSDEELNEIFNRFC
jgi:SNF2 family DNA or RNA helicase